MRLLLDTCALIWLCGEPVRLGCAIQQLLKDHPRLELCLSDASVLEIALKSATGKLTLPCPASEWVEQQIDIWCIRSLPLCHGELFLSADLPWHHRDPFDRLIIATAINHQLPVATCDHVFSDYGITVIW